MASRIKHDIFGEVSKRRSRPGRLRYLSLGFTARQKKPNSGVARISWRSGRNRRQGIGLRFVMRKS